MKKILRSRLPERLVARFPRWLVEIAVGLLSALLFASLRVAFVPWTSDAAPFALVFVSIVSAAVLAGWRSGLLALVIGQSLIWFMVIEPAWTFKASNPSQIGGLVLATLAQLIALTIIGLYQREIDRQTAERESRMELLDKALLEIDHRTTNNYQTVLAVVLAQARQSLEPAVREALQQVADRIQAVALASSRLALASSNLEEIRLGEHLREICAAIERGLFRSGVAMECEFDDVSVDVDRAVCISILANELVTNALKHAFPDDRGGTVRVSLQRESKVLCLMVEDDGVGLGSGQRGPGSGLGSRLIETFVKQLGASHKTEAGDAGTRHRIRIPMPG